MVTVPTEAVVLVILLLVGICGLCGSAQISPPKDLVGIACPVKCQCVGVVIPGADQLGWFHECYK